MIAKAPDKGKRGADTYGLLRYLFGPGRANEHTDPHVVAAWDPEWLPGCAFADLTGRRGGLAALARDLDAAMTGHEIDVQGGHVYHVVLSVPPADSNPTVGLFGDARWRELVESAIEHMGLGPDEHGRAGCRWVAVHHGLSSNGNDHVHLVVNVVRGTGELADLYRDWPRWRTWCRQVEERYGLTYTAPAGEGRAQATTRPELERAAAGSETDRDRLRRLVSEAAGAAGSEPEFVEQLRQTGVLVAPRFAGDRVDGYKVALDVSDSHAEPFWLAGSALRRDLSLPRLRARWHTSPPLADQHALLLWTGELPTGEPATQHKHTWRQVTRLLEQADTTLRDDPAVNEDPVDWHLAVERTADLLAVLVRAEPVAPQLRRVHDQLTRAAQLPRSLRPPPRPDVAVQLLTQAARLAAISRDPAPLVLAAIVLLVYGILTTLAKYAERPTLRAAARQQITTAVRELATHPAVAKNVVATVPSPRLEQTAGSPAATDPSQRQSGGQQRRAQLAPPPTTNYAAPRPATPERTR